MLDDVRYSNHHSEVLACLHGADKDPGILPAPVYPQLTRLQSQSQERLV